jgi:membrane protein YdbS with pleckstrin-like domain
MITEEEKRFLLSWEQNRVRKRKWMWKLAAGLPLAVLLSLAIFVNFLSGWYTRAAMQINVDKSGILVVLVALVLIVVFVVVFSARHKWDLNEQRYKELRAREKEL